MNKLLIGFLALFLMGCASENSTVRTPEQKLAIAKIHTELAASYYQRTQYAVALQELDVALRADPRNSMAYSVRGLVRMALREDVKAEADFRHSLELDNRNSDARNNYGWFMCQRGREREALREFVEAMKNPLYETPEISNVNAGICAKRVGELGLADEYLQRALILKPNFPSALIALAELSFSQSDYAGAKAYLLRYLQRSSDLTAPQLLLAIRIERKLGDQRSEESFTLQLQKRFPESREAQLSASGG